MQDEERPAFERVAIEPSWEGVIRWGGWSLFAAAVLLVAFVLAVIVTGQELPVPAEDAVDSPGVPTALFVIAAIGELLLAPAAIALYQALKRFARAPMVFATVLLVMASTLFLVSRGPIISLAQVSNNYRDATTEAARAGYLATAEYAIDTQNTYSTIALILLSVASIIIGCVMLRSPVFGRRIAYVAIAAGVCSVFAPFLVIAGVPEGIGFIGLALGAVWQLVVGLRLGQHSAET